MLKTKIYRVTVYAWEINIFLGEADVKANSHIQVFLGNVL